MKCYTFLNGALLNDIVARTSNPDDSTKDFYEITIGSDEGKKISVPVSKTCTEDCTLLISKSIKNAFPKITVVENKNYVSMVESNKDSNTIILRLKASTPSKGVGGKFQHICGTVRPLAIGYDGNDVDALLAIQHGGTIMVILQDVKYMISNKKGKLILSSVTQEL